MCIPFSSALSRRLEWVELDRTGSEKDVWAFGEAGDPLPVIRVLGFQRTQLKFWEELRTSSSLDSVFPEK